MNWYVLFVRGGKEEKILSMLNKKGFHAFLPRMEVIYRKQGKSIIQKKLMFPNYVFIESEMDYILFNEKLQNLRMEQSGIIKELKFDNEGTSALKEEEKQLIEELIGANKVMKHSVGYIKGDKVIVTQGSLKGLESEIVYINRHNRKAVLEISMFDQVVKLNTSLEIIEKIK